MASYASILPLLVILTVLAFSNALETATDSSINSTSFKSSETSKRMPKTSRGDYHHYDSYYPPYYNGNGHHKELDHYLIPILILLGLGVLLMPVLSLLMTGLASNVPVTTLVSGRKRREVFGTTDSIFDLLTKVEKAFDVIKKLKEN